MALVLSDEFQVLTAVRQKYPILLKSSQVREHG